MRLKMLQQRFLDKKKAPGWVSQKAVSLNLIMRCPDQLPKCPDQHSHTSTTASTTFCTVRMLLKSGKFRPGCGLLAACTIRTLVFCHFGDDRRQFNAGHPSGLIFRKSFWFPENLLVSVKLDRVGRFHWLSTFRGFPSNSG
jgi:hypothetical protein